MSEAIGAIILNWNCAEDTTRCLRAVLASDVKPSVIVVDNGSVDDSVQRLEALDEPFRLVRLPANLGYAGGMNAGIRAAIEDGATHVWLLNADCIPTTSALSRLLEWASRFAVSASLQVSSPSPDDDDAEPYLVAAMLDRGKVRPFLCGGCDEGAHEVDVVSGTSLFAETAWLAKVSFFDESFFHYKEEFDLVVRIAQAGGTVGFVCDSRVWHRRGGSLSHSSPRAHYYYHRNEVLYLRKHYRHALMRMVVREPVHLRFMAKAAAGLLAGGERRRASVAVFAGYWDGVRGVHGPTERF